MALDKLVDSTALDNGLTTVANAIRTKGGTTAQLSFPDGMAEAIEDLPSGGGLPPFIHKTNYGEYSFDVMTLLTARIEHGLGELPRGVFIWSDDTVTAGFWWGLLYRSSETDYTLFRFGLTANKESLYYDMTGLESSTLTDTFFSFNHGARYYQGGITYNWLAWA